MPKKCKLPAFDYGAVGMIETGIEGGGELKKAVYLINISVLNFLFYK